MGKNTNGDTFGVKKKIKKIDFWSIVDLGQKLTLVNS